MWRRPDSRPNSGDACRKKYSGQHVTAEMLKIILRPRGTQDFFPHPLAPLLHVLGIAYREACALEHKRTSIEDFAAAAFENILADGKS